MPTAQLQERNEISIQQLIGIAKTGTKEQFLEAARKFMRQGNEDSNALREMIARMGGQGAALRERLENLYEILKQEQEPIIPVTISASFSPASLPSPAGMQENIPKDEKSKQLISELPGSILKPDDFIPIWEVKYLLSVFGVKHDEESRSTSFVSEQVPQQYLNLINSLCLFFGIPDHQRSHELLKELGIDPLHINWYNSDDKSSAGKKFQSFKTDYIHTQKNVKKRLGELIQSGSTKEQILQDSELRRLVCVREAYRWGMYYHSTFGIVGEHAPIQMRDIYKKLFYVAMRSAGMSEKDFFPDDLPK